MRLARFVQGDRAARTSLGRAILHKLPVRIFARLLALIGACSASGALVACSWLLDWNYPDGGPAGAPSAAESSGDSQDAMQDGGESMDASADDSDASGGGSRADSVNSTDAASDADASDGNQGDGPAPCPASCGCCDSKGCHYGTSSDSCGNGAAQCKVCSGSSPHCNDGVCSSQSPTTGQCTQSDASACQASRCYPIPFLQVTTCCRTDNTCGCQVQAPFGPPGLYCQ
jgi:hypothetical protein